MRYILCSGYKTDKHRNKANRDRFRVNCDSIRKLQITLKEPSNKGHAFQQLKEKKHKISFTKKFKIICPSYILIVRQMPTYTLKKQEKVIILYFRYVSELFAERSGIFCYS